MCQYKDAVVEIQSEFILIGASGGTGGATCGTPLGPDSRSDVILGGNGFFIKGHYIVCPAQLVLLPPALTSVVNVYPFATGADLTLGVLKNQMTRASRILVTVYNVNGNGHTFVYEADLVGVDGAGDIALLCINPKRQWNICNPCIQKCHPYFNFGSSRRAKDGEKAYLIGDYVTNSLNLRQMTPINGIVEGLVTDHRYLDVSGFVLAELVAVSASVYAWRVGLPIINCQGQVIAMQTISVIGAQTNFLSFGVDSFNGLGGVGGPSEFFMRRVIKELIKGTCSRKTNCHLELIPSGTCSFTRYKKGYLGISYNVVTGVDYDITTDYTSGFPTSNLPRVRLSPSGEFLNSPSCKELVGIRVTGIAGANPNDLFGIADGFLYVPGGTATTAPLFPSLPVSPFLGKLHPGDIITHIECVALGDQERQIAPSLITWRLCSGDQIEICYRRGGSAFNDIENCVTDNYDQLFTYTASLQDYPAGLDYPWYSVLFPNIGLPPYNFTFPFNQTINPQWPSLALTMGAPFAASI